VQRVATLWRGASGEQRRAAERILDPGGTGSARQSRICLIGLRGAGKSTLGRLLAAELSLPFEELNRRIEAQGGMPVEDIIALYGQEGYRRLEHQALESIVAASDAVVLAVAGGIVTEPETFAFLLRHFHTVWLRATPEEHMARVRAQGDERPMAGNPKAMEDLRAILASREALYARAGAAIDTTGLSLRESLAHLREAVTRLGVPSA
jgi:XRE family aerobic/anaerobic benzoate catabolism transcriptional regulator